MLNEETNTRTNFPIIIKSETDIIKQTMSIMPNEAKHLF